MNKKGNLMKGGYSMEFVSSNRKKFIWIVVYNHIVEEVNDHNEIGIRGVGFNFFAKDKEGVG